MTFIIYQLYLNQYFKTCKFHSHWKLEFVRFLPAGKGTLSCLNLRFWTLRLEIIDHGRTFHLRQDCEEGLTIAAKLFWNSRSTFLSSIYPISWDPNMGQNEKNAWVNFCFLTVIPSLCPSLSFSGESLPKCFQTLLPAILKNALNLFHKLKNFFKYSLCHLNLNENLLPRQCPRVGPAHFL